MGQFEQFLSNGSHDTMAEWLRRGPAILTVPFGILHPARTFCVREFESRWCRKFAFWVFLIVPFFFLQSCRCWR
jgi:hypothetical protein